MMRHELVKVRRFHPGSRRWLMILVIASVLAVAVPSAFAQSASTEPCANGSPCAPCEGGVSGGVPCRQPASWPGMRQSGGCRIQDNTTGNVLPPNAHGDALFRVLSEQQFCPENALQFRTLLLEKTAKQNLTLSPSQVANRGRNNPQPLGLFSLFEAVTGEFEDQYGKLTLEFGDFFFGHFQAAFVDANSATSVLVPSNSASDQNLLFESVVWDPRKGMFNFYEIIANGQTGVWYYRGDSEDILADIRKLNRNYVPGELLWGDEFNAGVRLRCSGCHMNGGPIMKELKFPFDSWWRTERPLPLGSMRVAPVLQPILEEVVDAGQFSDWVKAGMGKLMNSDQYWQVRDGLSLQEQLRPLFCEQEVNLESDTQPFERPNYDGLESSGVVRAPVGFFVNPFLLNKPGEVEDITQWPESPDPDHVILDYPMYKSALVLFDSQFIDNQAGGARATDSMDKDHAFETPVKAWSDLLLIEEMVEKGIIDDEFVTDVLALDMTRPMFSRQRCSQLRLLPASSANWKKKFIEALEESTWPGSRELYENLTDAKRTAEWHRDRAHDLITKVQANAASQDAVNGYVRLLAQKRISVFHAEISQNPQGQIFEPDFRLIFPTFQLLAQDQKEENYGGVRDQFWLDPQTGLVGLAP